MELSDLKTGYIVETRDGRCFKVIKNFLRPEGFDVMISEEPKDIMFLGNYKEDMRNKNFDIIKVYILNKRKRTYMVKR